MIATREETLEERARITTMWVSTVIIIILVDIIAPCPYGLMKAKW